MKLLDAGIGWNPGTDQVEVGPWPDRTGWSYRYDYTNGAGAPAQQTADLQILMLFITFNTMVVRDQVDPQSAHRAFLAIDEYRQRISPDTPGADS